MPMGPSTNFPQVPKAPNPHADLETDKRADRWRVGRRPGGLRGRVIQKHEHRRAPTGSPPLGSSQRLRPPVPGSRRTR
jgi:hypothetical protein